MIKSLLRLSKPCARSPCTVISSGSGPKQCRSYMNSSQKSVSLKFNIFVSSSSRGKCQSPMKLQDLTTMKISEATPNRYTVSILIVVDHQKIRRRILEHPRKKDTREPPIEDSRRAAKEAEHQITAEVTMRPLHAHTSVLHVPWQQNQPPH
jgi:hypothetical protein